jgi:Zn-dependent protease with chaperone function
MSIQGVPPPAERKLLNVVEEMSIASGVSVPPVYVIRREDAINALVAGYSPNEAVIVVTAGAVEKLSRDELQGVMGHEFSHLLNGDMALNLRLAALLAGLTWIGDKAEALFFASARAQRAAGEEGSPAAFAAVFAAAVAFIGFPGTLAASAIRAAVSRQREFLADAASVQFTRHADAIAGALDSIVALHARTAVLAASAPGLAHMFFAPVVGNWFGFATHPPIDERIRRVHPRFLRDDYRVRRHGRRDEVAVLDGAGNVVKTVRTAPAEVVASVGRPTREHVDFSRRLLEGLPPRLRQALRSAPDAERVLFALGGFPDRAGDLAGEVQSLARPHVLTLGRARAAGAESAAAAAARSVPRRIAALVERDSRVTAARIRADDASAAAACAKGDRAETDRRPRGTARSRSSPTTTSAVLSLLAASLRATAPGKGLSPAGAARGSRIAWDAPLAIHEVTSGKGGHDRGSSGLRYLAPARQAGAALQACVEVPMRRWSACASPKAELAARASQRHARLPGSSAGRYFPDRRRRNSISRLEHRLRIGALPSPTRSSARSMSGSASSFLP